MKGSFAVKEVVDQGSLGLALRGTVISGQLKPGMEARFGYSIIIISQLTEDGRDKVLKRARKGQTVILKPLQLVFEVLKSTEGAVLEFEEVRTVPIPEAAVLNPDPT